MQVKKDISYYFEISFLQEEQFCSKPNSVHKGLISEHILGKITFISKDDIKPAHLCPF